LFKQFAAGEKVWIRSDQLESLTEVLFVFELHVFFGDESIVAGFPCVLGSRQGAKPEKPCLCLIPAPKSGGAVQSALEKCKRHDRCIG